MSDLFVGRHGRYEWVETGRGSLGDLVTAIPQLVRGHRIAVTSFDSGPFEPSPEESAVGWEVSGGVALSPVVGDVEQLATEGFDEWYIDLHWPPAHEPEIFVNYGGFSLRNPDHLVEQLDPTWDVAAARSARHEMAQQQARFWTQLIDLDPVTYLAEGDRLLCVTKDPSLFALCQAWFARQ